MALEKSDFHTSSDDSCFSHNLPSQHSLTVTHLGKEQKKKTVTKSPFQTGTWTSLHRWWKWQEWAGDDWYSFIKDSLHKHPCTQQLAYVTAHVFTRLIHTDLSAGLLNQSHQLQTDQPFKISKGECVAFLKPRVGQVFMNEADNGETVMWVSRWTLRVNGSTGWPSWDPPNTAGLITSLLRWNCYYISVLLLPYQRRHMTSGISLRGHVTHPTPPPSSNCSFQCGNHGNSQLEPVCDT